MILSPALVLQTAPAAVRVPSSQTLAAVRVLLAVLDLHLAQPLVRHHVHVVSLQVEQQLGPHGGPGSYGDVRVLDPLPVLRTLHHHLLEASLGSAQEGHGEVPGGGGGDGGEERVEGEDGGLVDRELSAQRSVDVQPTE